MRNWQWVFIIAGNPHSFTSGTITRWAIQANGKLWVGDEWMHPIPYTPPLKQYTHGAQPVSYTVEKASGFLPLEMSFVEMKARELGIICGG